MIVAAGLSPAWQQIVLLDRLHVGEVNRAREIHWCASGKVLNAGLALHALAPPLSKGGPGRVAHLTNSPHEACVPSLPPLRGKGWGWGASPGATGSTPENTPTPDPSPVEGEGRGSCVDINAASGEGSEIAFSPHVLAARTLALVGGATGEAIRGEFEALGVDARWVVSRSATRVCTTILDRGGGTTTELVENAGPILPAELAAFRDAYREEARGANVALLIGSLPAGAPDALYGELLAETKCPAIVDAQGAVLLAALAARPYVVKPNRKELGSTMGCDVSTDAGLHAAMREMNRLGATWVVVTQGKECVWIASANRLYTIEPPRIEPVNPIGSGDCLAAGIALALARGRDVPEAVAYGVAAAAENARQLLPARLDRQIVEAMQRAIKPQSL
ncbi:MAG: 1-phosphofructokinase family hexose kinase [Planctomycetaceae bacterium]